MWLANDNDFKGGEVSKCRHRVVSYLKGVGLDLGCGPYKIVPEAIGVDFKKTPTTNLQLDLTANDPLGMFSDCFFDYIFAAHLLEDFLATEAVLDSWWQKIKPGGYLILYGPDPDYYPRVGTPGANVDHKRDLYWQDVWKILKGFGNAKKLSASRHNDSNEFSWLLVVQKRFAFLKRPRDLLKTAFNYPVLADKIAFPRKRKEKKEALVIRYGAIGDAIWATPVVKQLKKEGYHVVYNCTPYSAQVLRNNPNIDEFLIQDKEAIPNKDLSEYWKTIGDRFDKVVNLSQSVEKKLLKREGTKEFAWSHKKRHLHCNVNYMDATMEAAGYPDIKGQKGELFFTKIEESLAGVLRKQLEDKFFILWALSGSSIHKTYPWSPFVAGELNKHYDDIRIITVGDYFCKIIEWQMRNTSNKSGAWSIRQSLVLTQYADLVIGPETGILNAAACYDTPKILFLSHSSEENLTKYWNNCTALKPKDCSCQPCHRLIYTDWCPKGPQDAGAKCAENIMPQDVYDAIMKVYKPWKAAKEEKLEEAKGKKIAV